MGDREPNEKYPIGNPRLPSHLPLLGVALLATACSVTLPDGQVVPLTRVLNDGFDIPLSRVSPTPKPPQASGPNVPPGTATWRPTINQMPPPRPSMTPTQTASHTSINLVLPTPSPTPTGQATGITSINTVAPSASPTPTPAPVGTARFPFLNGMLPASQLLGAAPIEPTT